MINYELLRPEILDITLDNQEEYEENRIAGFEILYHIPRNDRRLSIYVNEDYYEDVIWRLKRDILLNDFDFEDSFVVDETETYWDFVINYSIKKYDYYEVKDLFEKLYGLIPSLKENTKEWINCSFWGEDGNLKDEYMNTKSLSLPNKEDSMTLEESLLTTINNDSSFKDNKIQKVELWKIYVEGSFWRDRTKCLPDFNVSKATLAVILESTANITQYKKFESYLPGYLTTELSNVIYNTLYIDISPLHLTTIKNLIGTLDNLNIDGNTNGKIKVYDEMGSYWDTTIEELLKDYIDGEDNMQLEEEVISYHDSSEDTWFKVDKYVYIRTSPDKSDPTDPNEVEGESTYIYIPIKTRNQLEKAKEIFEYLADTFDVPYHYNIEYFDSNRTTLNSLYGQVNEKTYLVNQVLKDRFTKIGAGEVPEND